MTNNRHFALQHAIDSAAEGASPAAIRAAAETYFAFLEGQSATTSTPTTPPAPVRTGAEIIAAIQGLRHRLGSAAFDVALRRAEQLRRLPLEEAKQRAMTYLTTAGAGEFGTEGVRLLTDAVRGVAAWPARPTSGTAGRTGQAVISLLEGYRGRYGSHIDDLVEAATRAGFAGLDLTQAKATAVRELRTRYLDRFPSEAQGLIDAIHAL